MTRTLARLSTLALGTLVLLALTALPAMAAGAATKPDPEVDEFLIGSMPQLGTTAVVAVVIGILAYALLGKQTADEGADEHH